MSIRPHPTKGPGHWYIIIETRQPDASGKMIRRQQNIKFTGTRAEALAMDVDLNNKATTTAYPTLLEILPRFLTHYQNNTQPNSYTAMLGALKHLLPYYGEMRIPLISNHHHEEYKAQRLGATYLPGQPGQKPEQDTPQQAAKRRPIARSSINRELNCLKALLAYAEQQNITVNSRPKLFSKRQATGKTIMPLSPAEIKALLARLTGDPLILAMLMFWGGLRKNEATGLKWEDVDLQAGLMMIKGKGGGVQPVPLLGDLKTELKRRHKKGATGYICSSKDKNGQPKPYGSILKSLRTAAKLAGITKTIDHHLLRHTCGTILMASGAQQRSVQGILRHASIETTSIYTHLAAQFLIDEGSKMAGVISGDTAPRKPAKKAAPRGRVHAS